MSLAPGTRIGPYEIQSTIGAGGMGEVYRARDMSLGRDVAIKVLPDTFADDPERLARFEMEARTLAALNHPNIAQVYGLEKGQGRAPRSALVMELVEGETLRGRISRGPLPPEKAVDVAIALAEALSVVHAKGITHRDLKPENIFLTAEGRIKVLDFGLARWHPPDANADLTMMPTQTMAGVIMGTIGYMSPEQVRGDTADARSDIFALGCILQKCSSRVAPSNGPRQPRRWRRSSRRNLRTLMQCRCTSGVLSVTASKRIHANGTSRLAIWHSHCAVSPPRATPTPRQPIRLPCCRSLTPVERMPSI
jgi:serine/threonine protein kinase